jgi:hypothetical protein
LLLLLLLLLAPRLLPVLLLALAFPGHSRQWCRCHAAASQVPLQNSSPQLPRHSTCKANGGE